MVEIRRACDSEAEALTNLGKATFIETFAEQNSKDDIDHYVQETFSADKQLAEIRDPRRVIEIAWLKNEAAGFLHLRKGPADPSVTGSKPIELLRLYVHSQWHGKGIGASLMDRSIQLAQDEGFQTLWLGVWEQNFRAQAFYKKYDFSTVGKHTFRLGSDDQIDLILQRTIKLR